MAGRPVPADRLRKSGLDKPKKVRMAVVSRDEAGLLVCNCGWHTWHVRLKVAEERAAKHVDRKHQGQAMWL